jgi:cytochrome c-type biogenesis protein CcmE
VQRRGNPIRLVVALSVAGALAVFLLYTSFAGGATPSLTPSQLKGHRGQLSVSGYVLGPVRGDPHAKSGLRFALRDIDGPHKNMSVPVVFHGSTPDLFRAGRHVYVVGKYDGRSVAATSITTKCPSKYSPAKSS